MMERTVVAEVWNRGSSADGVNDNEPCYVISVASRMVGLHAQTLRTYERIGLLTPARSRGNIRMFSPADISRARWIKSLMEDLGINLAGVEVLMRMQARLVELELQVRRLEERLGSR